MIDVLEVEKGLAVFRKRLLMEDIAESVLLSDLIRSMGDDVRSLAAFGNAMLVLEEESTAK